MRCANSAEDTFNDHGNIGRLFEHSVDGHEAVRAPLCGARILQGTLSTIMATSGGSSSTLLMGTRQLVPPCAVDEFCRGHFQRSWQHWVFREARWGWWAPRAIVWLCEESALLKMVLRSFVLVLLRSQVKVVRSLDSVRRLSLILRCMCAVSLIHRIRMRVLKSLHVHALLVLCLHLLLHLVPARDCTRVWCCCCTCSCSPLHDAQHSTACVSQGLRRRRGTKGGVAGPAEDLRPVSEVEAGVNFRPAGQAREQVVVHSSGRRPGAGTGWSRGGAVTPTIHPEAPDTQYVPPGGGDWVSGNQWAGGGCVVPRGRGSGC